MTRKPQKKKELLFPSLVAIYDQLLRIGKERGGIYLRMFPIWILNVMVFCEKKLIGGGGGGASEG